MQQRQQAKEMVNLIQNYNPIHMYKSELEQQLSKLQTSDNLLEMKADTIRFKLQKATDHLSTTNQTVLSKDYEVKMYSFPSDEFTVDIAVEFFPEFKDEYVLILKDEGNELKQAQINRLPKNSLLKIKQDYSDKREVLLQKILPLIPNDKILFFETQNQMAFFDLTVEDFDFFIPQNIVLYFRTSCSSSRKSKAFFKENLIIHRSIDIRKFPISPKHIQLSLSNSEEGFDSILSNRVQGYADFLKNIEKFSTKQTIEHLSAETKFLKAPFTVDEKRDFVVLGGIEEELECLLPRQKRRSNS